MKTFRIFPAIALIITLLGACQHKEDMNPSSEEKYFPKVKNIIAERCLNCHSAVSGTWQGRPTAFDTNADIVASAASIKASVADPATPGPLGNKRMPADGELSSEDIAIIVAWFNKGGKETD